jgi:endonuclease YncB( thermonuclease family)
VAARRFGPCPLLALVLAILSGCSRDVSVVDGDTLVIGAEHVRLHGIDAPERDQVCRRADGSDYDCGRMASSQLRREIADHVPACSGLYRDRYERQIAICTVEGRDVGDAMVRSGWAIDVPRYSGGRYAAAEAEARAARRGLWAGDFENPARWRREHPRDGR